MQSDTNPYESPLTAGAEPEATALRRPFEGTVLIGLWLLEGGFKACFLIGSLVRGVQPLEGLVREYASWNRLVILLVLSFFMVETIGPWIGIYYLTGRRARTLPFETAIYRTLGVSVATAVVATLLLMLYCESANALR